MLPLEVVQLFHEIRQGGLFPFVWLATADAEGGARVRTVRLTGFNLQKGLLYFCCNRRHDKAVQILRDPVGEICMAALAGPMQLRFRCRLRFMGEADGAMIDRFWGRTSEETRRKVWGCSAEQNQPPEDFLAVEGSVLELDLLDLRPELPVRRGYVPKDGGFCPSDRPI
ncbi:MAG: pyridoxamine 5'-phosphate oxidase family protein [Armatimonadetes bacterium]|nr:pyridoxamine 5'-phosphate oxidase family protein [Armatimonadota bacterium]